MNKFKEILLKPRILILLVVLLMTLVVISPRPFAQGAVINSVLADSAAFKAGMAGPSPDVNPVAREVITTLNGKPIRNAIDYYTAAQALKVNDSVLLVTTKQSYRIKVVPEIETIVTNETQSVLRNVTTTRNVTVNDSVVEQNVTEEILVDEPVVIERVLGPKDIGLRVDDAPKTNIRKGLDLQGGTRVLLQPVEPVSEDTLNLMVDSLKQRLNTFGLSDIIVAPIRDSPGVFGEGQRYILVEIAGSTQEEVKDLVAKQGKFEAKISNQTVFRGGEDITYVCRTADCSGLDPNRGCGRSGNGVACSFQFAISLSPAAAQRQADLTKPLAVIPDAQGSFLSSDLVLYLDDVEVDRLKISADLQGKATTQISITGSGAGVNQQDATTQTLSNMKRLQTVLISGSLPVKLNIVRSETVSPKLGEEFLSNSLWVALAATAAVIAVLLVFYRSPKLAIPVILTSLIEVIVTLGIAALIRWNIDIAAVAGIIIAVGTGVNDQIVIVDEALKKSAGSQLFNWAQRIKRAFFVILTAYFTTVAAMVPLFFAGAGLLKGFAITTILGVSVGVFITRPAFAAIIDYLVNDEK